MHWLKWLVIKELKDTISFGEGSLHQLISLEKTIISIYGLGKR